MLDFFKAFNSMRKDKAKQIQQAYDFPKETVTHTMILFKNIKAMIC